VHKNWKTIGISSIKSSRNRKTFLKIERIQVIIVANSDSIWDNIQKRASLILFKKKLKAKAKGFE
jgi:hypothetical protein